jgi:hypothetical protein
MKKQNNPFYVIGKKFLGLSLAGFLLVGSASAKSPNDSITKEKEPAVYYIGTLDGQPVFRVHFDNQENAVYSLSILDEDGSLLYSEKIKGKAFSKSFKFERTDRQNTKLRFVLAGNKGNKTQVFQVDNNIQVINDVVVTRL